MLSLIMRHMFVVVFRVFPLIYIQITVSSEGVKSRICIYHCVRYFKCKLLRTTTLLRPRLLEAVPTKSTKNKKTKVLIIYLVIFLFFHYNGFIFVN